MERHCKIGSQTTAIVATYGKAKPILFYLWKTIPAFQKIGVSRPCVRFIAQKNQIFDNLIVKFDILLLVAMKKQERVNKKRKIVDNRNVECAVIVEIFLLYAKIIT